ncbi:MAG: ankyrin repeat domain-containing protein [Chlamydiia bacterium]|nr:ankyrin repeat domain-containing protein [Chlamydiia bacterium]
MDSLQTYRLPDQPPPYESIVNNPSTSQPSIEQAFKDAANATSLEALKTTLDTYPLLINYRDSDGDSLLHLIAQRRDRSLVLELVNHLVTLKADVNQIGKLGHTPLYRFLQINLGLDSPQSVNMNKNSLSEQEQRTFTEITKLLTPNQHLALNAQTTTTKQSVLHLTLWTNWDNLSMYLIRAGVNPNLQYKNGFTALHIAIHRKKSTELLKCLVEEGKADPKIVNNYQQRAIDLADQEYLTTQASFLKNVPGQPPGNQHNAKTSTFKIYCIALVTIGTIALYFLRHHIFPSQLLDFSLKRIWK